MKRKFKVAHQTATTLDEAFDAFIEEKTAINLSKSSIDNYQKSYNIFYEYHSKSYTGLRLVKHIY